MDTITTKKPMSQIEVGDVIDRLNTTFPECQRKDRKDPVICTNSISREPATEEEIQVSFPFTISHIILNMD